MKTTKILSFAFLLGISMLTAQTNNKPVTIRIKKVENLNGIEKITDSTYTTTDSSIIKDFSKNFQITENGKNSHSVIIENHSDKEVGDLKLIKIEEGLNEEIEKALKEAGIDLNSQSDKKMVIINKDKNTNVKEGEFNFTKLVIIKTNMVDASEKECKVAGIKQSSDKLIIEDLNCTPNPSNGKFNLKFSSPNKTSTDIIIKDISGKNIYTESLKQFEGSYYKEINLGENAKGIYFVTITQNNKATTKKLIVE